MLVTTLRGSRVSIVLLTLVLLLFERSHNELDGIERCQEEVLLSLFTQAKFFEGYGGIPNIFLNRKSNFYYYSLQNSLKWVKRTKFAIFKFIFKDSLFLNYGSHFLKTFCRNLRIIPIARHCNRRFKFSWTNSITLRETKISQSIPNEPMHHKIKSSSR